MDDVEIVRQIGQLADEEHTLEGSSKAGVGMSDADLARLKGIEVALDQCWDLLRQRRARRNAGQPVDEAAVRPAEVVEGYRQ